MGLRRIDCGVHPGLDPVCGFGQIRMREEGRIHHRQCDPTANVMWIGVHSQRCRECAVGRLGVERPDLLDCLVQTLIPTRQQDLQQILLQAAGTRTILSPPLGMIVQYPFAYLGWNPGGFTKYGAIGCRLAERAVRHGSA